jgi:hypothetical protein
VTSVLSVSGAFGVYRRDIYELAGGSSPGSDGGDLDMTIRIHQQLRAWWRLRGLAGAVLRRGPAWAAEPGSEGRSGPAFGVPAGGRHVQVR